MSRRLPDFAAAEMATAGLAAVVLSVAFAAEGVSAAETSPPVSVRPAVSVHVAVSVHAVRLDDGLAAEGGTLRLALLFGGTSAESAASPGLTVSPAFTDGWGRVLWAGEPAAIIAGSGREPGRMEFAIPYPPLPPGGYLFRGTIRDDTGATVATTVAPVGRFETGGFPRDLAWLYWAGGPVSDATARKLLEIGINGGGGYSPDFRFPYRFFIDHAGQLPIESYPEETVLAAATNELSFFRGWVTHGKCMGQDGGLVLANLTDEVPADFTPPAMRAVRLRLARRNRWMKVPTIGRFNDFFRTDFLSWDEVFRDGFPPLDHPQFQGLPIGWTADRESYDVETPMMRAALIREVNPAVVLSPGATHCLTDEWADSFNDRAYNINTTLDFIQRFISAQPAYGLRPGNKLFNLKPGFLSDQGAYQEAHEHLYWAALATNARMFLIYGPGDGYGSLPATADGEATPEGSMLQAIHHTIHPLRPTIMATRNEVDPTVLFLDHGHEDGGRNLMDGLVANGIMPLGGRAALPETRLIFAIDADVSDAVLDAVRRGAVLVCNRPSAALGIEATDPPPAPAWQEIDLGPLSKAFPGLDGVKVVGSYGRDARVAAGSGLEEVRAGGKLLAITGAFGKGWVLYLNVTLQNMVRGDNWGTTNMSLMGDDSIPDRNASLVRTILARAGVPERLRITDRSGRVHPLVRGMFATTADAAQKYLFVVSEPLGKLSADPADPKQQRLDLACENPLTGVIRILDPAVKAVRDLRTGKMLPVRSDRQSTAVEFSLVPGQGTILSLLTAPPAGDLAVRLSHAEVVGNDVVQVELTRRDAAGAPVAAAGHSLWVRFLDPGGREVEALTRWATGGGPHVFTVPFALDDPEGEWTVVAEDQTDGTRIEKKLRRNKLRRLAAAAEPRPSPDPMAAAAPPAFTVAFAPTPYLDGDLILTAVSGTIRCMAKGALPVTLRLPAGPAGPAREVTVTSPQSDAPVPFSIPLSMTRGQAQAAIGLRHEGVEVTAEAPGLPPKRFRYRPNILPLSRGPRWLGLLTGGTLTVRVNNFMREDHRVTLTVAAAPGEEGKAWQATSTVPAGASAVFDRTVVGLPGLTDPGLYDLPLEWSVDGVAQERGSLPVDAACEQVWWVTNFNPLDSVKPDTMDDLRDDAADDIALEEPEGEAAPAFPDSTSDREKAGWRRAVTQGVVWWADLVPRSFTFVRILVATDVVAPADRKVRIAFFGPAAPGTAWVNGKLVATGPTAAAVPLRKGRNTVITALEVTGRNPLRGSSLKFVKPGFSLALLDPAAGKRERSLRIGQGVGGRIPSPAPDASQTIDRTTRAYPDVTGGAGILPAITTIDEAFAPEEDPLRVAEPTPQEWWILTRNPLADVTIAGRQAESESDDAVADISLEAEVDEPAPMLPESREARGKAGWRAVATQGVVTWAQVAPGFHFGRILAATQIHAAEDRRVRLAFGGSFHPGIVWVNGERVATGDASAPVQLRKGPNTVVLAIEVAGRHTLAPPLNPAGMPLYQLECWLVPLDPETGSRDLGVRIGAEAITSGE